METQIKGNTNNPKILVIGGFHGDEPQGVYLINKYLESQPETKILFIPCLNENGYKNNTRVNKNGVDLNRNFPTKNWVLGEKNEYFGGESPASEYETKELIEIIEKYKPKAILTLHSPYKIVNYDGKGSLVEELAQKISQITSYPVESDIGYPTPGSFGTWAGIERNIPTITLELDEEINVTELEKPIFEVFKLLEDITYKNK